MGFVRVIPCLLLRGAGLVKTVRFREPTYVGDPRIALRIFNEREVDELVLLDIQATPSARGPDFRMLSELTDECFMPLAYGGGLRALEQVEMVLRLGVEKVVVNTRAVEESGFVTQTARHFGCQSVVVSIDVERGLFGKYEVVARGGRLRTGLEPVAFARQMEEAGAGELLLNSVDRDGTMQGYDLKLVQSVTSAVGIPVIACGGAGSLPDLRAVTLGAGASAAAAGSLFVFRGRHRAVLINYPESSELRRLFGSPQPSK